MARRERSSLAVPEPIDRPARLQALERACHEAGIPVTPQRTAVLEAVLHLGTHPTADEVLAHLSKKRTAISRATVFRTLESLAELGLIAKTCHPGRGVRFDRVTSQHHHLVCLKCAAMVDFVDRRLDALPLPDTRSVGFHVSDYRVQVRGLCQTCHKEKP